MGTNVFVPVDITAPIAIKPSAVQMLRVRMEESAPNVSAATNTCVTASMVGQARFAVKPQHHARKTPAKTVSVKQMSTASFHPV